MASPTQGRIEELVSELSVMFSGTERRILKAALFLSDWDLEAAANWLLEKEDSAPTNETASSAEGAGAAPDPPVSNSESSATTAAAAGRLSVVAAAPTGGVADSIPAEVTPAVCEGVSKAASEAESTLGPSGQGSGAEEVAACLSTTPIIANDNGNDALVGEVVPEAAVAASDSLVQPSDNSSPDSAPEFVFADRGSVAENGSATDNVRAVNNNSDVTLLAPDATVSAVIGQEATEESSMEGLSSSQYWDVDRTLGEEEGVGGVTQEVEHSAPAISRPEEDNYEGSAMDGILQFGVNSISASMLESITSSSGRPEGLRAEDLQQAIETAVAEKNEVTEELSQLRGQLVEVRAEQVRAEEECLEANRAADAICAEVKEYRRMSDLAKQSLEERSANLFGMQQQLADDQWRLLRHVRNAEKSTRGVLVELQAIRSKLELRNEAVQKQRKEAVEGKAARLADARRDLALAQEVQAGIVEQEKMLNEKEEEISKDELALQDGANRVDELQGKVNGLLEELDTFKREVADFLSGAEGAEAVSPGSSASHEQSHAAATAEFPSPPPVTLQLPPMPAGTESLPQPGSNSSSLMVFHTMMEEPLPPFGIPQQHTTLQAQQQLHQDVLQEQQFYQQQQQQQQMEQEHGGEEAQVYYDYHHSPTDGGHASDSSNSSSGHASAYPPVPFGASPGPSPVNRATDRSLSLPQSYGSQDLNVFRSSPAHPVTEVDNEWEILNPSPPSPSSSSSGHSQAGGFGLTN
eukprot:TRINITY_DN346_c5_g1_i1.p1 TRINITY_DN346_c5_g1~~TRINITY_DN346_c5_g1_i1.p1  ORF type:complete len:751 (-),score=235.12 TRINITY_DN346_c5_g1_i1:517-2769(-)